MNPKARKTLEDFPKFSVSQVTCGATNARGFTRFELNGEFDRTIERRGEINWFWLLIGERATVCVQWEHFDEGRRAATIVADEKERPDIAGKTLYYLSPAWEAYHVWMVLDEEWGWQRVLFQSVDAVAETFEANDVSIVDGREVKTWTKLIRADKHTGTERYAPELADGPTSGAAPRLMPGGWDHEHCQLCRAHIDDGDFGYRDRDDLWTCESCYEKYVKTHDLSFVDDL